MVTTTSKLNLSLNASHIHYTLHFCEDVRFRFWTLFNTQLMNNILLSVSVRFLVSTFESFLGFREFFPRLSAIFFKRAREHEVKLRHVYEV